MPPLLRLDLLAALSGIAQLLFLGLLGWLPLLVVALFWLAWRRPPWAGRTLLVCLGPLATATLLLPIAPIHYNILLAPGGALAIAPLLEWVLHSVRQRAALLRLAAACVLTACGVLFTAVVASGMISRPGPLDPVLRGWVRPGDRVLGPESFWFAVPEHPFVGFDQLGYYQLTVPGSDLAGTLAAVRPDVIIMDGSIDPLIVDDPAVLPEVARTLILPRAAWTAFLARQATLLASYDARSGPVRVYRVAWPRSARPEPQ